MYRSRTIEGRSAQAKPKARRFGMIFLSLLIAASGLNILGAAVASASCPTEYGWQVTARSDFFKDSGVSTPFFTANSKSVSIVLGTTATASMSSSQNVSVGASYSVIVASAEAKYGLNWETSTSWGTSWSATFTLEPYKTARLVVWKRASNFTYKKWSINALCQETWSTAYYQKSPFGPANQNSSYCIGLDYGTKTTEFSGSGCTAS
jgi:hypothetical protein